MFYAETALRAATANRRRKVALTHAKVLPGSCYAWDRVTDETLTILNSRAALKARDPIYWRRGF